MPSILRLSVLALTAAAAGRARPERPSAFRASAPYRREIDRLEAPLERAARAFEAARRSAPSVRKTAAGEAFREGRRARDAIGALTVPSELARARQEELIFLNHDVLGFQAFAAGAGGQSELTELESILRRGRVHRRRAREAIP